MGIYVQPETTAAERVSFYRPGKFCPIHLGDVLSGRYHIFRKLGYGGTSTVWLARDESTSQYVAVKVYSATARVNLLDLEFSPNVEYGWDRFAVHSIYGKHTCVILEPLGRDIRSILDIALSIDREYYGKDTPERLRKYNPRTWTTAFTREACRQLLVGLSDLHRQQIAHRDLAPGNLMLALSYDLKHMSMDEIQQDVWASSGDSEKLQVQQADSSWGDSKSWDDMNLSRSQRLIAPVAMADGQSPQIGDLTYLVDPCSLHDRTVINEQGFRLLIIDLGLARRFDDLDHPMSEQANYRPPEQILSTERTHYSDIFSAGLVMWEMVMNRNLVWSCTRESSIMGKRENDNDQYLKDLEIRLGPLPASFQKLWKFRDDLDIPEEEDDFSYGDLAFAARRDRPASMSDIEVKLFVDFVKQALQWVPQQRPEAAQLLEHEWFRYKPETEALEGTLQES